MYDDEQVVAVGLLTAREVAALGDGFRRLFPIADQDCYGDLLRAIDEADRAIHRQSLIKARQV